MSGCPGIQKKDRMCEPGKYKILTEPLQTIPNSFRVLGTDENFDKIVDKKAPEGTGKFSYTIKLLKITLPLRIRGGQPNGPVFL